jgi:DNA-binding transcriptional ArsR family regulator
MSSRRSGAAAVKTGIRHHASVFAALGDETRLAVLARLARGQAQSITRLTEGTRLTRQAVTKHLRVLQGAGVVRSIRVGRETQFALEPKPIDDARVYLDGVARQWDDALARLKAFVEVEE